MWLTLGEAVKLGLNPDHYRQTSKNLRVLVAGDEVMHVFVDLKTGKPVLFFENCDIDRRALVEVCCNLAEVDHDMTIGIITVEKLLKVLVEHPEPT